MGLDVGEILMPRTAAKVTQAKITKAVKAVTEACGGAQVVFETDGRVRVVPATIDRSNNPVDYFGEIRL